MNLFKKQQLKITETRCLHDGERLYILKAWIGPEKISDKYVFETHSDNFDEEIVAAKEEFIANIKKLYKWVKKETVIYKEYV